MPEGKMAGESVGPINVKGRGEAQARGIGRGRMEGNMPGSGPGGSCVCVKCDLRVSHSAGVPCRVMKCPKCGGVMVKE
jgi:hypothetical protein